MRKLNIIDMFCGGGGESTGLISAAQEYNFDVNMSAINHWERAIETHSANYPFAEHRIENVQSIKPETLKASVNTDLLWTVGVQPLLYRWFKSWFAILSAKRLCTMSEAPLEAP